MTGFLGDQLAEKLTERGHKLATLARNVATSDRPTAANTEAMIRGDKRNGVSYYYGDLSDSNSLFNIMIKVKPNEIYNLGAMSHVKVSFEIPEYVGQVDALGPLRILEAVRLLGIEKKIRIYQASTSELYGGMAENKNKKGFYDENSPFYPRSPYGVAKIYGFWITKNYREAYDMFACNGILFNHESPRRGETFVTRKITRAVAKIALGEKNKFYLGNLDAKRDWGHAKDYVRMMWMILQADKAEDWVIATGKTTTVREFVKLAFNEVGVALEFKGKGVDEKAYVVSCSDENYQIQIGKEILSVDPQYYRPTEVDLLIGDPTKAKEKLGWIPEHDLSSLVKDMMASDIKLLKQ
mgnify:CR=1 FL=1